MRFDSLSKWLSWQETLHPKTIDLGLDRCMPVVERLELRQAEFPIVTVAGTNGKGSVVAMLEAILRAAGYRTGAYTSPHLVRYNERICIDGMEVDDETIMASFERIDYARESTSLTYFEFATLAGMDIFKRMNIDAAILEVGLGGRLDAVNLFDADIALVTTVDIDHVRWLGNDRELIGREKAGIFRSSHPAVYGDSRPLKSLEKYAKKLGTPLFRLDREYSCTLHGDNWDWYSEDRTLRALPRPALAGPFQIFNASAALMALNLLSKRRSALSVPLTAVRRGLETVRLPGRFQILPGPPERILDVAHNPQAAKALAEMLWHRGSRGRTLLILAMLADKDIPAIVGLMKGLSDLWYVASLNIGRGASAAILADIILQKQASASVHQFKTISEAYLAALADAAAEDRLVVFGSFYAIGEILQLERNKSATTVADL
jgi:dihydrofolate synthase/folylpolyglutamate synthase